MIRNTFTFLKNISKIKEQSLYKQGIKDWQEFLEAKSISGISKKSKIILDMELRNALDHLKKDDHEYLALLLERKEHWRAYHHYKDECIFLDIETSSMDDNYITCITLFDGYDTMTFVRGKNLDYKRVAEIITRYKMIVTFNGNTHDLPFLGRISKGIIPDIFSWDLRHSCAKLGLKGSLKDVERSLGIERPNHIVKDLKGGDPILLWRTYLATGDDYYLELLVEYNQEDTINLKTIADRIYGRLVENLLISS